MFFLRFREYGVRPISIQIDVYMNNYRDTKSNDANYDIVLRGYKNVVQIYAAERMKINFCGACFI